MSAHFSKLTSKSQSTLPRAVREALGVGPGDALLYRVEDGKVVVEKAPTDPHQLAVAQAAWGPSWAAFSRDWLSPEDCRAFDDL